MASASSNSAAAQSNSTTAQPQRGIKQILHSYFYWTYSRGSIHFDIMVTLILLFIFITPHLWDYGAKPPLSAGPAHPMQVVGNGRGVIVTVQASDVTIPAGASYQQVKRALRQAIEPVMGDSVFVEKWQTVTDTQGNLAWQIWAHR
jgi:hypothetical protein